MRTISDIYREALSLLPDQVYTEERIRALIGSEYKDKLWWPLTWGGPSLTGRQIVAALDGIGRQADRNWSANQAAIDKYAERASLRRSPAERDAEREDGNGPFGY